MAPNTSQEDFASASARDSGPRSGRLHRAFTERGGVVPPLAFHADWMICSPRLASFTSGVAVSLAWAFQGHLIVADEEEAMSTTMRSRICRSIKRQTLGR